MNKRGVAVLFVLTLLTAGFSLYQDTQFDSRLASEHARAITAERDLASVDVALASARAAQSMYGLDAPGASAALTRVSEHLDTLEQTLRTRRNAVTSPELTARYDAALENLAEFRNVDVRARAALSQNDRSQATALVANDATAAVNDLAAEVQEARELEQKAIAESVGRVSLARTVLHVLSLLLLVAACGYLSRLLSRVPAKTPTMAEMIRDLPPPVKNGAPVQPSVPAVATPTSTPIVTVAAAAAVPTPPPPPASTPAIRPATLAATAELCVDLARLLDGRDVPALLARASAVLDAKGIMIWSADADADVLRPSLAHGYAEKVLRKMQPLAISDENITSQTFRTMQPQTMNGVHVGESTAIAVPLISSGGCVGVMAAEIRQTRSHADVMALARIIAAQFATIMGPPDQTLSNAAEA